MTEVEARALCRELYDFLCTRRVSDFVDPERALAAATAVSQPGPVQALVDRFVVPARERLLERAAASHVKLGAWFPSAAREAIATWLGHPVKIPREIVDEVVTSEWVRDEVRGMLEEAFRGAFRKAGGGVMGAAIGLFGRAGDRVQSAFEDRLRDFLSSGVTLAQKRIARAMASPATAKRLGKLRRRLFLDLLARRESEVAAFLTATLPFPTLDALTAPLVHHNIARDQIRVALRDEVAAAVAEASKQPIGDLLDELGLREVVRGWFDHEAVALATAFVAGRGGGGGYG